MKKKYIIIAGVARAGKSTLSSKIAMEMGYQHMQMDAIIDALEKTLPGAGINTHTDSMESISEKMARFINGIMASEEYAKFDYGVVFDICQLLPQDYEKYIDKEQCDIFYLVTRTDDVEKRLEVLQEYDTADEYTYHKSLQRKRDICREIMEESELIYRQCQQYDLSVYDTLYDREEVFAKILGETSII